MARVLPRDPAAGAKPTVDGPRFSCPAAALYRFASSRVQARIKSREATESPWADAQDLRSRWIADTDTRAHARGACRPV